MDTTIRKGRVTALDLMLRGQLVMSSSDEDENDCNDNGEKNGGNDCNFDLEANSGQPIQQSTCKAVFEETAPRKKCNAVTIWKHPVRSRTTPKQSYGRVQITDLFGVVSSSDSDSSISSVTSGTDSDEDFVPGSNAIKGGRSSKKIRKPVGRPPKRRNSQKKQAGDSLELVPSRRTQTLTRNRRRNRFAGTGRGHQDQTDCTVAIIRNSVDIHEGPSTSRASDEQSSLCIPFLSETAIANALVRTVVKPPLSGGVVSEDMAAGTQEAISQSVEKYIWFCNNIPVKLRTWISNIRSGPVVFPLAEQIFNEYVYLSAALESTTPFSEWLRWFWKTLLLELWNAGNKTDAPISLSMLQDAIDAIGIQAVKVLARVAKQGESIQNLLSETICLLDEKLARVMEIKVKYLEYAEELKTEDPNSYEINMIGKTAVLKILNPAYAHWVQDCSDSFVIAMIKGRSQKWSCNDLKTFKSVLKDAAIKAKCNRLSILKNHVDAKFLDANGRSSQDPSATAQFRYCIKLPHPNGTVEVIPEFTVSARVAQEWYRQEQRKVRGESRAISGDEDLCEIIDWENVSEMLSRNIRKFKSAGDCKQAYMHEINPRAPNKRWSRVEVDILLALGREVEAGSTTWQNVAQQIKGRTDFHCFHQYRTLTIRKTQNRPVWNSIKDNLLLDCLRKEGPNWDVAVERLQDPYIQRHDVQLRWKKKLNPCLKMGAFSRVEDILLMLHMEKLRGFLCKEEHFGLLMAYLPWRFETVWRDRANCLFSDWVVPWTLEEDKKLMELAEQTGGPKKWQRIAAQFTTFKNRKGCLTRYKILKGKIGHGEKQFRTLEEYHIKYSITRYNVFEYKHLAEIETVIRDILKRNLQVPPFPGYPADRPPKLEELQWMLLSFDRSTMITCVQRLRNYQQYRAELWKPWRDKYGDSKKTFDRRTFRIEDPQSVASALQIQGLLLKQQDDVEGGPLTEFEQLIYLHYARFSSTKAVDRAKERPYLPSSKELAEMAVVERIVKPLVEKSANSSKQNLETNRMRKTKISAPTGRVRKKKPAAIPIDTLKAQITRRPVSRKRRAVETNLSDTEGNVPPKISRPVRGARNANASRGSSSCASGVQYQSLSLDAAEQNMQWKLGKKISQLPTLKPSSAGINHASMSFPSDTGGFSRSYEVQVKHFPVSDSLDDKEYFTWNSSNSDDITTSAVLNLNLMTTTCQSEPVLEKKSRNTRKGPPVPGKGKKVLTMLTPKKVGGKRVNIGSDEKSNCRNSRPKSKRISYRLRSAPSSRTRSDESSPSNFLEEPVDLRVSRQLVKAGSSQTSTVTKRDTRLWSEENQDTTPIADTGKVATSPMALRRGWVPPRVRVNFTKTVRRSSRGAGLPAESLI